MASFVGTPGPDAFYGGEAADTASGFAGDDHLYGGAGDDHLEGGDDADLLVGESGADTIDGGAGDDVINSGRSFIGYDYDRAVDTLRGGAGADRFLFEFAYVGQPGNLGYIDHIVDFRSDEGDVIQLRSYTATPLAWVGAIASPAFNLNPGSVFGRNLGPGHQGVFTWTNASTTYLIIDTNSSDTLDAADFVLALDGAPAFGVTDILQTGDLEHVGTQASDVWTGTAVMDIYYGLGGADTASGLAGDDELHGGDGDDILNGGDGQDILIGEYGGDTLNGGAGDDLLYAGNRYNGFFDTQESQNTLRGDAGNDTLVGSHGIDLLDGGDGDDLLNGGKGDRLLGGAGADQLISRDGAATLDGGAGDDLLYIGDAAHAVTGGAGADTFVMSASFDGGWEQVGYSTVADFSTAQGDLLAINGPHGFALTFRGAVDAGFTLQDGKAFSSTDYGPGFTQVWTWANAGDSFVIVDADRSGALSRSDFMLRLTGVTGLDIGAFRAGTFEGAQAATNGPDIFNGTSGIDTYRGLGGDDTIRGGDREDYLYGNDGDDQIWGEADGDWLYGGRGKDLIDGGAGRDVIRGGAGDDTLYGGDGDDDIQASGNELGDDDNASSVNFLYGGAGNDALSSGFSTFDVLHGGDGDDSLYGRGTLYGDAGNDSLLAGSGALATLYGGDGDDTLKADDNAVMHGGAGRDQFIGGWLNDEIHINLADLAAWSGGGDDVVFISDTPAGEAVAISGIYGGGQKDSFVLTTALSAPVSINGEQGEDTLDVRIATSQVTVDLSRTDAQQTGMGQLALESVENVIAGDYGAVILGSAAANGLVGGALADQLSGAGGSDVLTGGGGNDAIDGGSGADIASYAGAAANYSWTRQAGGAWVVRDLRPGSAEGVDTLSGIETLRFADRTIALLPVTTETAVSSLLRFSEAEVAELSFAAVLATRIGNGQPEAATLDQIIKFAANTTSVATMTYAFFTGRTPSEAGYDYLVHGAANPNDLNDPYYANFNLVNRYINFAANLGAAGEGKAAFQAEYGALNLSEAFAKAYEKIIGFAPTSAKVTEILNADVGVGMTRAQYLAAYGGDGLNGLGTKAAAVGFLLSVAVLDNLGPYAQANQNFLVDLADGDARFGVDLLSYSEPASSIDLVGQPLATPADGEPLGS